MGIGTTYLVYTLALAVIIMYCRAWWSARRTTDLAGGMDGLNVSLVFTVKYLRMIYIKSDKQ